MKREGMIGGNVLFSAYQNYILQNGVKNPEMQNVETDKPDGQTNIAKSYKAAPCVDEGQKWAWNFVIP